MTLREIAQRRPSENVRDALLRSQLAEQGPAMRNPVPEWLRRENDSVLDSVPEKAAKAVLRFLGADDPNGQVLGLMAPVEVPRAQTLRQLGRLERAVEQGYGPTMYHETAAINEPSLMRDGFDLSRGRARLSDDQMPDGVFLKPDPNAIGLTMSKSEAVQLPVRHRAQNVAEFADRDALRRYLTSDEQYAKLAHDATSYDAQMARKFDDLWKLPEGDDIVTKGRRSRSEAKNDALEALMAEWTAGNEQRATLARARATEVLKEAGHDGIRVRSDRGSFGRNVDTTVVFDPAKVRSVSAAFDPTKLDSKSLLASIVLPATGTTLYASQRKQGPQ